MSFWRLEFEDLEELLTDRTRLVAFTHCSNILGTIHDAKSLVARLRARAGSFEVDMKRSISRWCATLLLFGAGSASVRAESEDAMNGFACSLYAQLGAHHENLFFSPFSIQTALAMAGEGARTETAREMASVLGLEAGAATTDWSPLHARLGGLADRLAPKPAPPKLLDQLKPPALSREALDQLNTARSHVRAAKEALGINNILFANELAQKALTLAKQLTK